MTAVSVEVVVPLLGTPSTVDELVTVADEPVVPLRLYVPTPAVPSSVCENVPPLWVVCVVVTVESVSGLVLVAVALAELLPVWTSAKLPVPSSPVVVTVSELDRFGFAVVATPESVEVDALV
jgi:hypothetical protein